MSDREAMLVLEDGRIFQGSGIGFQGEAFGEVVFNTSMTGYQEIMSDPSYCGQIITFTAPQIGNYGVTDQDLQAALPALSGVVIRELSPLSSNWRSQGDLGPWLTHHRIVGIDEVDTRALTRHLRERGAMRGGIWTKPPVDIDPVEKVRASPTMVGADLTGRVTTKTPYRFPAVGDEIHRVVLLDYGVKRGILKNLSARGIAVRVLPASATAEQVLAEKPDGVVLSNGPGDPAAVHVAINTTRALIGRLPLLGICLGHQIMGLALGGTTYKLRFGHHGGNHPVHDEITNEIWITAQNHGFAVDPDSLPRTDVTVTHISLYDHTLEGFASQERNFLTIQFHPEACPGPSDATGIFDRFLNLLNKRGSHAPAR